MDAPKPAMNVFSRHYWQKLIWLGLLAMLTFSYWDMRVSAMRLNESLLKEQDCSTLIEDIHHLRNRPGFAALTVDAPRTITTRAEQAGQRANLSASSLVRIEPQPAARLGDSPYRLRPTRLELRQVTLEQVIRFAHAMVDDSQGTTLRDLRLTNSSSEPSAARADDWKVEVVLTQLIFAPTSR